MQWKYWAVALVATLGQVSPTHAKDRTPIEAFASLPNMSMPTISPDGTMVAFAVKREDGNQDVMIRNIAENRDFRIDMKKQIPGKLWFEDGNVLFVSSGALFRDGNYYGRDGKTETVRYDTSRREWIVREFDGRVVDTLAKKPGTVLAMPWFIYSDSQSAPNNIFTMEVDIASDKPPVRVERIPPKTYSALTNIDGQMVARVEFDPRFKIGSLFYKNPAG